MSSVPPPPPPPPPPGGGDFNAAPPPPAAGGAGGGAPMQNNLVLNIIGTVLGLFCCCGLGSIPGIIGIVFATQVNKLAAAGDIAGAQSKANTAKILGFVSIALGALGVIYWIFTAFTGGFNFNLGSN